MGRVQKLLAWFLLLGSLALGCAPSGTTSAGSAAESAARGFFDAVIREDWPGAYQFLSPESRNRARPSHFTKLCKQYIENLGYQPEAVLIRSSQEYGKTAMVYLTITGRGNSGSGRTKESVVVQQTQIGWMVMLPPRFGEAKKAK
jgi:hypothetical protein